MIRSPLLSTSQTHTPSGMSPCGSSLFIVAPIQVRKHRVLLGPGMSEVSEVQPIHLVRGGFLFLVCFVRAEGDPQHEAIHLELESHFGSS